MRGQGQNNGITGYAVLVLCCSQLIGEVYIMVYDTVRDWGGTRCMDALRR